MRHEHAVIGDRANRRTSINQTGRMKYKSMRGVGSLAIDFSAVSPTSAIFAILRRRGSGLA
jgi:hypothetical protein